MTDFPYLPTTLDPFPEIRQAALDLAARFDLKYWRVQDQEKRVPVEFFQAVRDAGWLGIMMPEDVGGSNLGLGPAAALMEALAEGGGAKSGNGAVHGYIFGPNAVARHGSPEQRKRMLPPLVRGEERPCFAITEPHTGLDTTRIRTRAVRQGDKYIVNGQKVWTTAAHYADRMLLLARTSPIEETSRPIDGVSIFYTKIDRRYVDIRPIDKHGVAAIGSNEVFFTDWPIPAEDLIGQEGKGFRYLVDSINPERVLLAAGCVGTARLALRVAARYANDRIVFGRPIGQNQGIQHPLAKCWMEVEAAKLMTYRAAELYDAGKPCGAEANAAKFLAAEASFEACKQAVITLGGFGYSKEFHAERWMREVFLMLLAPISQQLVMCYIAERVLGQKKSY